MVEKEKVLFLCTGNSDRTQMAEDFLRDMAGDRFEVYSAELKPSVEFTTKSSKASKGG